VKNYAGHPDPDDFLRAELEEAGITVHSFNFLKNGKREVDSRIMGEVHGWSFKRAWYYWVAEGPGLPPRYANTLHETHGKAVRVEGHCGCPSPLEYRKGFAVGMYHVDTQEGLKALADMLKRCAAEASAMKVLEPIQQTWTQGWTSDSVAAQVTAAALTQVWNLLGVENQTQAVIKLETLKKTGSL